MLGESWDSDLGECTGGPFTQKAATDRITAGFWRERRGWAYMGLVVPQSTLEEADIKQASR